jgi:hypothetical protein
MIALTGHLPMTGRQTSTTICFVMLWWILFAQLHGFSSATTPVKKATEVFPEGETLVYEVGWDAPSWMFFLPAISAGEMTVQFQNHGKHEGTPAYKITLRAVSSGFLPKLTGITVDDSFESIVDASEFCSRRMTKKLREGKRHRDIFLSFNPGSGKGHYLAFDVSQNPPVRLKDDEVKNVPDCVQDILSAFYLTRLKELKLGDKYPLTLSDDGEIKQVEVNVRKKEPVEAAAGKFQALRLETISVSGTLFKGGGNLLVWLSDDERKIPVKFEAKVKLGRVYGTIKEFKR